MKDFHFSIFFYLKLIFFPLFNTEILPFIWTLFFGSLRILREKNHFLFWLHLFPKFILFGMMRNVLDAIKTRYKQFLIIILIIFFNYNSDRERICSSYLNCFSYLVNTGLKSGGLPFEIKIL